MNDIDEQLIEQAVSELIEVIDDKHRCERCRDERKKMLRVVLQRYQMAWSKALLAEIDRRFKEDGP